MTPRAETVAALKLLLVIMGLCLNKGSLSTAPSYIGNHI